MLDIQANVKQIQSTLAGLDQRIDKFGQKVGKSTGTASAGFAQFGLAVSGVQQAFGILNGTVGKVFSKMVEHGAEFEFQMDKVRGVLGDLGTDENMSNLQGQAKELGSTTMKSAGQVAGLQFELSKLGFNADEIMASTGAITNMGIAFDVDLSQVAEVAGSTLRAFGMEASETTRMADVMAKAFSTSALDIDKFTNSMVYVAPVAKEAGMSIEETTAVLGLMANKGIHGSIAGTALRSIFQQLADSGSDLAKKIGRPVVGFEDMIEAFQQLEMEGQDLTSVLSFMDRRTAGVFAGMIKDTDTIELMKEAPDGSAGSAEKLADIMSDNLKGDMVELESATEGFWIAVHELLDPALRGVTQTISSFVQGIDSEEIKAYSAGLASVGIVAVGVAIKMGKLTKAIKVLKMAMVKSGWGALVVGVGLLVGAVIDATNVFEEDTDEIDKNTEAMERNRQKSEKLKEAREEIANVHDVDELAKLKEQKKSYNRELNYELKIWKKISGVVKPHLKHVVDQKKTLTKDYKAHYELDSKAWNNILLAQDKQIVRWKGRVRDLKDDNKQQMLSAEARDELLGKAEVRLRRELTVKQFLLENEGLQYDELMKKSKLLLDVKATNQDELAMINLQIEKVETRLRLEMRSTKTTEEKLKYIQKIADLEQRLTDIAMQTFIDFSKRRNRIDDDNFDKKINRLDDEEERDTERIKASLEANQQLINSLVYMRDNDKTLQEAENADKKKQVQSDINSAVAVRTRGNAQILEMEKFYDGERAKVEEERITASLEADNEIVQSRYEMGKAIKDEEQMQFDAYLAHIDARLEAEKLYSEEWFALMSHREDVVDDHIEKLTKDKYKGFQQALVLLQEEADAEETSAERKKEIQDRMAELTIERLGKLRGGFKEFLKGELVDFLTAQQIKLFGKLAEILATGATTLGTSLIVSLPLYAGAIAMLEVAKNKVNAFAKGGLIDSPTLALMGEAGSEVVIPEKGFKEYVRDQIVPYQNQLIQTGLPSNLINQNFSQQMNAEKLETLTAINTTAIQQMKDEIKVVSQALKAPQTMTITDGSAFATGQVHRGSL